MQRQAKTRRAELIDYALALLAVGLGFVLRIPLASILGAKVSYVTFIPVVMLSAWRGGFGPGVLCTVLSAVVSKYFFIEPLHTFWFADVGDALGAVLFVAVGSFQSWVTQQMLDARTAERQQRRLTEQTLASIGDAVIVVNAQSKVIFLNGPAEEITGWPSWEALGTPVSEVFPVFSATDGAPIQNPAVRAIATGMGQTVGDAKLISRRGRKILIDDSASPVRNEIGTVTGAVLVFRDVTARREAEKQLIVSGERLRTTLESIADAFFALDRNWRFTYVNRAAERFMDRSRGELIGHDHWEEYPDLLGTELEEKYRECVRESRAISFEYHYRRRRRWYDISAYPAADGGLSVYFRNITDRKEAEAALLQSQAEVERARELLQTTLSSIGDGVVATDLDSRITFMNGVAALMSGVREDEAVGRLLSDVLVIVNETTRRPNENPVTQALRDGVIVGVANHTLLLAKDGRETPIDDSAAPIRKADGSMVGAVLVFRDVTERRAAQRALKESEERLRLALRVSRIGVWDWDIVNDSISWSERVYALHGLGPGEFSGKLKDLVQMVHPEDRTDVTHAIQAALEKDTPYHLQFRAQHSDGAVLWLETTGQVFRNKEGRPVRMLGATTDITERKQAEMELRRQGGELQRSNADLERFAIAASHDLQEPLRMISIYSQKLSRQLHGALTEDSEKYLEFVVDGTRRMQALIEDLLAYSRVAYEPREVAPVDAGHVLNSVLQFCNASLQETQAVVTRTTLPVVKVQESQLAQVFLNLIMNAIRYRKSEPPTIEVAAERDGSEWVFSVKDNGIGIPLRHQQRVFELFKRIDRKLPGSGIGLALCQRIIEGYGGRIWVESQPDQGSTFYFTLPAVAETLAQKSKRRSPIPLSE